MKNNSRNWVFKIFGDFGRFWWIGWSADDIYIFIIENNLKKIRKFLDQKLINLTIGITSVFSTLIPVIFLNSSESILKYTGIGRHKNNMIFTYDGIWGFSLKFLGNIKKGLRVGPLGLWIFGKRFIAYFLPKCTWTSDFKKNVNWSKTWLTYHVLICSILYFHPYSHEQSPRQSGPSGRRPFLMSVFCVQAQFRSQVSTCESETESASAQF